jgi:glycosyltransferase involved in cell wall biosynthesis
VNQNNKKYTLLDWEKGEGLHYPNWLAKKIFKLSKKSYLNKKLKKTVVSILIPCLNEISTIEKVLKKISNLKIDNFDLVLELIVIDGGSNDGSIEIIKKFKNIKFYSLNKSQKGDSIKFGINKSKGDIIVFFPSDNEYECYDIEKVITPILLDQSKIVYGSRMIKCISLDKELLKIYKNNFVGMLISKYGGKLINLLILAFFNKSISDPFTSLKAFDAELLKSLNLNRKGFDMDFEIFVKLNRRKNFFLEVPVRFKPRENNNGKKMTIIEGFKCLIYLLFNKHFI